MQSIPVDLNRDKIIDQYNITMRIRKPNSDLFLSKVDLIIAFDYQLKNLIKMKMEGLTVVSVDTMASTKMNPGKVRTTGTIDFIQPNAMK